MTNPRFKSQSEYRRSYGATGGLASKLYGSEPVFIYDPKDNRPVPGLQDNAINSWKVYPKYCPRCHAENFYDTDAIKQSGGTVAPDDRRFRRLGRLGHTTLRHASGTQPRGDHFRVTRPMW